LLERAVEEGLTLLVVGKPADRAQAFLRVASISPRRLPSLFLSSYPGSTKLLVEASRGLGLEPLLDSVLVSTVAAEASSLAALVSSLSPVLSRGTASTVAFDALFAPALKAAGGDLVERGRLAVALSTLRASARRGRVPALIMEAPRPPRLLAKCVDAVWPPTPPGRRGP